MLFSWLSIAQVAVSICVCLAAPIDDTESYRAPMYGESQINQAPIAYIAMFKHSSAHDIDQHWEAIGMNLSSSEEFRKLPLLSGYTATMVSTLLVIYLVPR